MSSTKPSLRNRSTKIGPWLCARLWPECSGPSSISIFDVDKWLEEHGIDPLKPGGRFLRNREWFHMVNEHVISMPDKWEYPWYAAWDLAFHTIALSTVDPDFAKEQLDLMLQEFFIHPTGQIPAYEWNFSDVNPPVHAWATIFLYRTERAFTGKGDVEFLKRSFAKLMLNFSWWVNRKDRFGKNLFEGGFLGTGQHRRLRPQRAAAHRRQPGAGGRHGVGRHVCPEHAGDRHRVGGPRRFLRRHGA